MQKTGFQPDISVRGTYAVQCVVNGRAHGRFHIANVNLLLNQTCKIMARADFCEILPAEAGFQEGCQDEDAERRPLAQQVRPVQYQSQYV